MALTGKSREQIRVAVRLPLALERFAAQSKPAAALKQHLLRSLNELVDALAIPAEIVLDFSFTDRPDGTEIDDYEVALDGARCRLRSGASIECEIEPHALARVLAWDICRNRELLISSALCERIWGEWCLAQRGAPLGEEESRRFREFLALLVRRGFRVDRGCCVVHKRELLARTDWSQAKAFEQSVAQLDAPRIQVWCGQDLGAASRADVMPLEQMLDTMRDGLFYELGLSLPEVNVHYVDDRLAEREFRIQLNDLHLPPIAGLLADQFLVNATTEELAQHGMSGSPAVNPANGNRCSIVADRTDSLEKCRDVGYRTWGPGGYMVLYLAGQIRSNAGSLIDAEVLDYQLRFLLPEAFPDLVEAALKRFGVTTLTQIIRELLDEEISVRDLRAILESLLVIDGTISADWAERVVFLPSTDNLCPVPADKQLKELNIGDYVSRVRMTMSRYISHNYTGGQNKLFAYLLAPQLETRIRACGQLPLSDAEQRQITSAILDLVGSNSESPPKPVVLTTFDVRKSMRDLLEREFPYLPVLSLQELAPGLDVEPLGRITPRFQVR
jgi:hypothetical protein